MDFSRHPGCQTLKAWLNMYDVTQAAILLALGTAFALALNGVAISEFVVPLWSSVPARLLVPTLTGVAVAVAAASHHRWVDVFGSSVSAAARSLWTATVTGVALLTVTLPGLATDPPLTAGPVIRNFFIFTALALSGTAAASSKWAWVGPAAYSLLCLVFGQSRSGSGGFQWWAGILEETTSPHATYIAISMYLLAFVSLLIADGRRE
ncbi:hypothetical protein ABT214_13410 [Micromonospora purpureochromogenes]|uniref:hypothetical protein n=1 Tax=Micromonospora purpureochromogenes TaxID=47872 RepID=UPI003320B1E2